MYSIQHSIQQIPTVLDGRIKVTSKGQTPFFAKRRANDINMWPNAVLTFNHPLDVQTGGPSVVVSTAALHAGSRFVSRLKETKNVSSPSTRKTQYCMEPP